MKFTLITKQGTVMSFFIKATAECFQQAYGGVIITNEILTQTVAV